MSDQRRNHQLIWETKHVQMLKWCCEGKAKVCGDEGMVLLGSFHLHGPIPSIQLWVWAIISQLGQSLGRGIGYEVQESKDNLEPMSACGSITTYNHNDLQKVRLLPHFCLPSLMQIPLLANAELGLYSVNDSREKVPA